jgi:formyltetrahydrofolate hydrolase
MNIALYANRSVGITALLYLKSKGHNVAVFTDNDSDLINAAFLVGCDTYSTDDLGRVSYMMLLSVHGRKIISQKYLLGRICINIHPCIEYKGHNPIKRYIENEDVIANVTSHYMTEKVDEGEIIHKEVFGTGKCGSYAEFYNIANPVYYIRCLDETLKKIGI